MNFSNRTIRPKRASFSILRDPKVPAKCGYDRKGDNIHCESAVPASNGRFALRADTRSWPIRPVESVDANFPEPAAEPSVDELSCGACEDAKPLTQSATAKMRLDAYWSQNVSATAGLQLTDTHIALSVKPSCHQLQDPPGI